MQKFICRVVTPQGQVVEVKLQENDKMACIKKLKRNGMTPISIEPSFTFGKNSKARNKKLTATIHSKKKKKITLIKNNDIDFLNTVSLEELKEFTEDLITLRKSNFKIDHALKTIINKVENQYFKKILQEMLDGLIEGKYLYKTMKEYKNVFPQVYRNLIKTGELSQMFDDSLTHAITYLEDELKIKSKIKNIIIPNLVAFAGIILMLFLAVLVVIPNVQDIFMAYGTNIAVPKFVLITSNIINLILKYWFILLIILGIGTYLIIKYIHTEKGSYKFNSLKYNNFLIGKLWYLLDFSRMVKSIIMNLKNRMRIEDALEISKNATKNTYMHELIEKAINNVYTGKSWLDAFDDEKSLSSIVLELLKRGSKSNDLKDFALALDYLDKEIDKEIDKLLRRLPIISYGIVGIALILFIVTILIPCMQVYLGGILFI